MIYKNTTYKINEDFNFGKIKGHRVEDDYQISYSSIRTHNKIKLSDVTTCLYNWTLPKRFQKFKGYNDVVGQYYTSKEDYTGNAPYNSQELSKNEIMELQNAGFTKHRISRDTRYNNPGEIDTWLSEILDSLLPISDGSSYSDASYIIDVKYWLSPDEGIAIIYYMSYNMQLDNRSFKGRYCFFPIFVYTGLVSYSINQQDKDKIKESNKLQKILSRASTFFRIMYTRLATSWNNWYTKNFIPKMCKNGHLISILNRATPTRIDSNLSDATIEDLFFDYNITNGLPPALRKFYGYDRPNMPNILHKYNQNTNDLIAGYITQDKCMCLYYISDYDIVCKLIGSDNAQYLKPSRFYRDTTNPNVKDNLISVYIFWYVTDLGMELFDLYNKREVDADDIKSDNVDNKFKKFKD